MLSSIFNVIACVSFRNKSEPSQALAASPAVPQNCRAFSENLLGRAQDKMVVCVQ